MPAFSKIVPQIKIVFIIGFLRARFLIYRLQLPSSYSRQENCEIAQQCALCKVSSQDEQWEMRKQKRGSPGKNPNKPPPSKWPRRKLWTTACWVIRR